MSGAAAGFRTGAPRREGRPVAPKYRPANGGCRARPYVS
ncbi:hypothetical protein SLNWT_2476 [Streptomyces albus]|uniref:Uncharacterized protein n=1 Tax=Streptomyces albus (strain ATCC 21838 / DSM 41398 / FERM P-419 / JCM 4703 / NBRC 107858) TaxID=1081613 RepID=A0A0B5EXN4_STRA4|nr:hypothetical protein SLNWT_2476 [Streptomyces albus]